MKSNPGILRKELLVKDKHGHTAFIEAILGIHAPVVDLLFVEVKDAVDNEATRNFPIDPSYKQTREGTVADWIQSYPGRRMKQG